MHSLRRLTCLVALALAAFGAAPAAADDQGGAAPVQTPPPAPPAQPVAEGADGPDTLVVVGAVAGLLLLGGALVFVRQRGAPARAASSD